MKGISILGSTGSIGQSALAVVDAHPDKLRVVALAARGVNRARFDEQVAKYRPARAVLATEHGPDCLIEIATHPDADVVLFASSGTAALDAVLAAIDAGKTIALANKEVLVMAGSVVMAAAQQRGVAVLPVDSEHNAIHQCLHGRPSSEVKRLILTASGGPFREMPAAQLAAVTAEDALRHPTWRMGPKITIDSATLMNKGLEVIEARWLFDVGPERVDVVVHPQSVVHSLVEMRDGSWLAQLGVPDMRVPIAVSLAHPERLPLLAGDGIERLDLARVARLDFEAPDPARFPCLALAYAALASDEVAPAVLNAANEEAVAAFLAGRIPFPAIADTNAAVLAAHRAGGALRDLRDVLDADAWARARAGEWLAGRAA